MQTFTDYNQLYHHFLAVPSKLAYSHTFSSLRHFRSALKLQSIIVVVVVATLNLLLRLRRLELLRKRNLFGVTTDFVFFPMPPPLPSDEGTSLIISIFFVSVVLILLRFGKSFLHPISHRGIVFVVSLHCDYEFLGISKDISLELIAESLSVVRMKSLACLRALPACISW